jgi:hypothetical protein
MSENEVDIAGSLFANDAGSDNDDVAVAVNKKPADLDFGDLLNNGDSDDGEGDEAFIAMQQRRSNRKSSNLQGKSVKKGGGFQAMGECPSSLPPLTVCRAWELTPRPQASMRTSYAPSPARASRFPPLSSARRSPSSSSGATSWAWPAPDPARRPPSSSP